MSRKSYDKKNKALAHNILAEANKNIFPVGSCTCGGSLFLYLQSKDENIKNIYCDKCDIVYDAFNPKDGPIFFVSPLKQVEVLKDAYGVEKIEALLPKET